MFDSLVISSPKRSATKRTEWDRFFPYYAGFSESFAQSVLGTSDLDRGALVCDPWNGSGTTTYIASRLGYSSLGLDINPVMLVAARARLLSPSEADSLEPLATRLLRFRTRPDVAYDDPLLTWYSPSLAALIRRIETRIHEHLVGDMTVTPAGVRLDNISGMAATFYVALFAVCRFLASAFRTSNPTWVKLPRPDQPKAHVSREIFDKAFRDTTYALASIATAKSEMLNKGNAHLRIADTTNIALEQNSIDLVLTSPPYCTRLDYASATRVELAVLHGLCSQPFAALSRKMIGSIRVPTDQIDVSPAWGETCVKFLNMLKQHRSKASSGYYYKTHLDYFNKIATSIENIAFGVKPNAPVILVVQDSYYKDIHNDLPAVITEMARNQGLTLRCRRDFHLKTTFAGINTRAKKYKRPLGAIEAVLCFEKC